MACVFERYGWAINKETFYDEDEVTCHVGDRVGVVADVSFEDSDKGKLTRLYATVEDIPGVAGAWKSDTVKVSGKVETFASLIDEEDIEAASGLTITCTKLEITAHGEGVICSKNVNFKLKVLPEPPDAKIVSLDYSPSEPKQNDTVRIDYLLNNVGSAGKVAVLLKWLGRNEDGTLNGEEYEIVNEEIDMDEGQLSRRAFFTMPDFDVDVVLTTESWDGNDWVNHHKKTVFINKREIKEVVLNDYSLYVCPEEGDCYSPANCTVTLGDCPTAIVKFNVTNPNSFSVDVVASAQVSTPSGFETVQKSATLKANETSDIWLFDVSLSDVGDYTITRTDVSVVI